MKMRFRTPIFALAAAAALAASAQTRPGRAGGAREPLSVQQQPPQQQTPQEPRPTPPPAPQPTPPPSQPDPLPAPQPAPGQTPSPSPSPQSSPAEVDEGDVLSVETNLVNVLFNAVDRDRRYVTDIRREDLRVFENDRPQEIAAFQHETNLPISIAVLVDISESQRVPLPDEREAAKRFVNTILRPGRDELAVLSFAGTATVEQDLTDDAEALRRAIDRIEIEPPGDNSTLFEYEMGERAAVPPAENELFGLPGSTALWDAVWATSTELMARAPRNARRAVVVLSDGDDSSSRVRREEAVEAAVRANAVVYSIGFESQCDYCRFDKKALRRLAEETGGRAFFPRDASELNAAFGRIEHELRTQYLLSYAPSNAERDGSFRRIRLELTTPELRKRKIKLSYREGYYALPPQPRGAARPGREPANSQQRLRRPPRRPRKN